MPSNTQRWPIVNHQFGIMQAVSRIQLLMINQEMIGDKKEDKLKDKSIVAIKSQQNSQNVNSTFLQNKIITGKQINKASKRSKRVNAILPKIHQASINNYKQKIEQNKSTPKRLILPLTKQPTYNQKHSPPPLFITKELNRQREADLDSYLSDPSVLEEYRLRTHRGRGSFSVVSGAVHRKSNEQCAIKVYTKIDQIDDYKLQSIKRQIRNLFALKHRHIVRLHHAIKDKKKLLLVMQDAGSNSLAGVLRKHKILQESVAKKYFSQILLAVKFCHENAICHRDIKPENILIDQSNCVRLIDFGFSARTQQKLINWCGTPPFMAPQVLMKMPYNGKAVDIWSLGVVLYLMLYGRLPFKASNEQQLYRIIQQGKYKLDENISISREAIYTILMMLKVQTKDRATVAQIVQSKWLQGAFDDL